MSQLQRNTQPFLVLGTSGGGTSLTLTDADFERHKWIMGISGSGKSTLLAWIALSLLRLGIAFCVIDPHGDLARHILSLLASSDFFKSKQAEHLWFIDFARSDRTIPFNVLKQPHFNNYQVANNLLEAIHRAFPTSTGTTTALDNTITYTAFVLAEHGMPITQLQKFLLNQSFRNSLLAKITDEQIIQFFDFSFADKVSSQLIESTLRRLNLLIFSPALRAALGHKNNKLNFRYLMDNQISCLISLGGLSDSEKRLAGCLLMTGLEQAFLSRASLPPDLRLPYHVIVDEFPLFSASGDSFSVILEQVRKYKGTLYLAHQTLSQLQKGMLGSLQNAIPIIMKAGTDDSSALVGRFYRPVQEKPAGFFESLFWSAHPLSPFANAQNVTQARMIFEHLERQEALVAIHYEVQRIVTPTVPMKEDRKLLERIEDMYAARLLVPIQANQAEETRPTLTIVSSRSVSVVRRTFTPAPDEKGPLTFTTGILDIDILLALHWLHYATLPQVATFCNKETSSNYVRQKLNACTADKFVDKVTLPRSSSGKPPSCFYLTTKGQAKIADILGSPLAIATGDRKMMFLEHTTDVNSVVLAALQLARSASGLTIVELRHERQLKVSPLLGGLLVPDLLLEFRTQDNQAIHILCEIDRSSENKDRILSKLTNYKTFISSGSINSLTVAFIVTVGGAKRVAQLMQWSQEILRTNQGLKEVCLFGSVDAFSSPILTDPLFTTVDNVPHALIEQPF